MECYNRCRQQLAWWLSRCTDIGIIDKQAAPAASKRGAPPGADGLRPDGMSALPPAARPPALACLPCRGATRFCRALAVLQQASASRGHHASAPLPPQDLASAAASPQRPCCPQRASAASAWRPASRWGRHGSMADPPARAATYLPPGQIALRPGGCCRQNSRSPLMTRYDSPPNFVTCRHRGS